MSEVGLRERKVAESRLRTEHAAIDLCLEHGFAAVTVDMICDAAEISARTFYNYFGTREAALLGDSKPMPSEDAIQAYTARTGASEVEEFATLIAQTFNSADIDRDLVRKRRQLMDISPELATLNFARVTEARGHYADIVSRRVAVVEPSLSAQERTTRAQYIVALTMGAMQVIGRGWLHGHTDMSIQEYLREAFVTIRHITQTLRPTGESTS
ncbi:TetR/AcrR family transcriptional regulator [Demequina oxidasica]|uniref:TetR/AcrR family transcriptional regulator n=1 Tax=Demequina oxidasica TaxID=676199 RepID=UPI0007832182|nr:TetR/AcrR family transcriptional regulator [Demequina oxidasica]